jgi:WD40 repeat protein
MNRTIRAKGLELILASVLLAFAGCSSDTTNSNGGNKSGGKPAPRKWVVAQDYTNRAFEKINWVSFSPDSQRLAVVDVSIGGVPVFGLKGDKFEPQTDTGFETDSSDYLGKVHYSRDGNTLVAAGILSVWSWDARTGKLRKHWEPKDGVFNVAISPDGQTIATPGGKTGDIMLWDSQTGASKQTFKDNGSETAGDLAFSPDGRTLASAASNSIKLWDVATGTVKQTLNGHTARVGAVIFSADGTLLASSAKDKSIKLWDTQTGALKFTLTGHAAERIPVLAFSPDGSTLASGADDKTAKLWNVQDGTLLQTITEHGNDVIALDFSPDGKWLATASNTDIKFWKSQ